MVLIGCGYHPGFQQIAFVDTETGEFEERRLVHSQEADVFFRGLKERGLRLAPLAASPRLVLNSFISV